MVFNTVLKVFIIWGYHIIKEKQFYIEDEDF